LPFFKVGKELKTLVNEGTGVIASNGSGADDDDDDDEDEALHEADETP
jgi:hypothetical protein